jgi:molybdopterin converting factor small subunit
MENEVQFYGMIAEKLGISKTSILIDFKGEDVNVRDLIIDSYPLLKSMTFQIAINNVIKENISSAEVGKIIAILPPFAGG